MKLKEMLINVYELYHKNEFPVPDEEFVLDHDREYLTKKLVNEFQFFLRDE